MEELDFTQLGSLHRMTVEKSLFSLLTPEIGQLLLSVDHAHIKSVVLMGIEVCIFSSIRVRP